MYVIDMVNDGTDFKNVCNDFPILKNIVYLDSGASTQKPRVVIDGMKNFYEHSYSNVHRGMYPLAEMATEEFEKSRDIIAKFIGAQREEVIFTRGTTDGINMIARSIVSTLQEGDEIIVSEMEHHSNFVPWQQLAIQKKLVFKIAKITPDDILDMDDLKSKITSRTKVIAITHISNVLGTINPIHEIAKIAHSVNALLVVDGAQAIAHIPVNVKELDCDAYAFSGHKMYGPDGVGVLYAKKALLESLPPSSWGGEMVSEVTATATSWNELPYKFEPGTPPITQAVGLGIAVDYLYAIGLDAVRRHEEQLILYANEKLQSIQGLHIIGPMIDESHMGIRSGIISFVVDGVHPHDVAQILSDRGVCIRAGHHCAHPLHCAKSLTATSRISFGIYTTTSDIDAFVSAITHAIEVFR